jgi:hypothetical protein
MFGLFFSSFRDVLPLPTLGSMPITNSGIMDGDAQECDKRWCRTSPPTLAVDDDAHELTDKHLDVVENEPTNTCHG